MVYLALARKMKPDRPKECENLTDDYWEFIQGCWGDTPENRPTAEHAHMDIRRLRDATLSTF